MENRVVVVNHNKNRDYYENPTWMNFNNKENSGKKKLFLAHQSVSIMFPNVENLVLVPNHKKMEIITRIQVYLIS